MKKRLLDFWYGQIIARLWQMKRKIVLWRDKGRCRYCQEELTPKTFTVDHVLPLSAGGSNAFRNLFACCKYCNKLKADALLSRDLMLRMWKAAQRRALNKPQ